MVRLALYSIGSYRYPRLTAMPVARRCRRTGLCDILSNRMLRTRLAAFVFSAIYRCLFFPGNKADARMHQRTRASPFFSNAINSAEVQGAIATALVGSRGLSLLALWHFESVAVATLLEAEAEAVKQRLTELKSHVDAQTRRSKLVRQMRPKRPLNYGAIRRSCSICKTGLPASTRCWSNSATAENSPQFARNNDRSPWQAKQLLHHELPLSVDANGNVGSRHRVSHGKETPSPQQFS